MCVGRVTSVVVVGGPVVSVLEVEAEETTRGLVGLWSTSEVGVMADVEKVVSGVAEEG